MSTANAIGECAVAAAQAVVGDTAVKIQRVLYSHEGQVDQRDGPLQVTFASGRVVRFEVASDGESISSSFEEWVDPFQAAAPSAENERYVAEHGKWTSFDLTFEQPWSRVIGSSLEKVAPVGNSRGATTIRNYVRYRMHSRCIIVCI